MKGRWREGQPPTRPIVEDVVPIGERQNLVENACREGLLSDPRVQKSNPTVPAIGLVPRDQREVVYAGRCEEQTFNYGKLAMSPAADRRPQTFTTSGSTLSTRPTNCGRSEVSHVSRCLRLDPFGRSETFFAISLA